MPDDKHKIKMHCHSNALFQIFNSLNFCMICSSFILSNKSSNDVQIKLIKPDSCCNSKEITPCPLWSLEENNNPNNFSNKKDYLKQRQPLVKNLKYICTYFSLSLKTYFLSIEYLDRISSKISFFNPNALFKISLLCLMLATKLNEHAPKMLEVQKGLKNDLSKNYLVDEIYVLKLLNYNLNVYTSYDMLLDILNFGFIFEGEEPDYRKMNYFYNNLVKILYFFSEINSYIELTAKQTAVSIVAFTRELLDLNPFNESIKSIFLINQKNQQFYYSGLEIIKKKIKIEGKKKKDNVENESKYNINNQNEGNNTLALFCNKYKKLVK